MRVLHVILASSLQKVGKVMLLFGVYSWDISFKMMQTVATWDTSLCLIVMVTHFSKLVIAASIWRDFFAYPFRISERCFLLNCLKLPNINIRKDKYAIEYILEMGWTYSQRFSAECLIIILNITYFYYFIIIFYYYIIIIFLLFIIFLKIHQ